MQFIRKTMLWLLLLPTIVGFAGAASNQLVLYTNDDKFPVMVNQKHLKAFGGADVDGMLDDIHCVMTHQTHLNFLADIFDFHHSIQSIGDLLIDGGDTYGPFAWVVWAALMLRKLWV
jgi:Family of unknown function (DUF5317)